ncbi:MAG: sigma-70 family RNA polymerase sigma factor [bacterium]
MGTQLAKYDFEQIYSENKGMVWRLISRYVFCRQDREDLFQEVFLKVHKALAGFWGQAAVKTWIYRIAVNTALNYVKRQNRYKWMVNIFEHLRPVSQGVCDPSELEAYEPLKKLNARQRMVLILSDIEDKKMDEIADIMKLPVGTVKSNLHRAREIVKKEVSRNERA